MKKYTAYNNALLFILLFLTLLLISVVLLLIFKESDITGHTIAEGGNITALNLSRSVFPYWKGYYGNVTGNTSGTDYNVTVGMTLDVDTLHLDLRKCYVTELYATLSSIPQTLTSEPTLTTKAYMNSLEGASTSLFNSYFNFTTLSDAFTAVKGDSVFQENLSVEVGDSSLTIYGTTLRSQSGNYTMGLLKDTNNDIVLVFTITNGTSFFNAHIDYEMMLPVPPGAQSTYYFFQDSTDDCGFPNVEPASPAIETPSEGATGAAASGTGVGGIVFPRCGDRICNGKEECSSCALDCAACPLLTRPEQTIITEAQEITSDKEEAEEMVSLAEQLLEENNECERFQDVVLRAQTALAKEDYTDAVVLAQSFIRACSSFVQPEKSLLPVGSAYGVFGGSPIVKNISLVLIATISLFGILFTLHFMNLKKKPPLEAG